MTGLLLLLLIQLSHAALLGFLDEPMLTDVPVKLRERSVITYKLREMERLLKLS